MDNRLNKCAALALNIEEIAKGLHLIQCAVSPLEKPFIVAHHRTIIKYGLLLIKDLSIELCNYVDEEPTKEPDK